MEIENIVRKGSSSVSQQNPYNCRMILSMQIQLHENQTLSLLARMQEWDIMKIMLRYVEYCWKQCLIRVNRSIVENYIYFKQITCRVPVVQPVATRAINPGVVSSKPSSANILSDV